MNGFPHPLSTIPKIRGKHNRRTLDEVLELIAANAAPVDTLLGGGLYGFTEIYMSSTRYDVLDKHYHSSDH